MAFQRQLAATVAEVTADMTEAESSLARNLYIRNFPWMSISQGSEITTTFDEVPMHPFRTLGDFAPSVTMHPGESGRSRIGLTPASVSSGFRMEQFTIMPQCAQGRNRSLALLALDPDIAIIANGIAADITLALVAADIAPPQPLADRMLTDPHHLFFGLRCREMLAVWHEPFYILLMLAAWKKAAEESCDARLNNREAKKPRTEH